MNRFFSRRIKKAKKNSSSIQIYHHRLFPWEDLIDVLYPLFYADYQYEDLIALINAANHIFCAYDENEGCVGCALLKDSSIRGLYVSLFGVRQSSQHRGVGTQLLEKIIRWARRTYYRFISLHVHVLNHKAIGLYEKVGFRKEDYLTNFYYQSSKPKPDAFQMILYLR
ncbi:unnamed protein product [Rotaria sordida]|uniref:N-terminal methionine N(alpha)-acetyltransferase NatE n=1 Tax=Rotaria sordida TaxID=392033 RepID=A0A818RKW3_9BILA|nr:unnamed protein product [Rotaria sordida]CAF3652405.1 unnamed protein product [Rotaria sordida]CAF3821819.1 unnamed protein product [Rotaria sordida]